MISLSFDRRHRVLMVRVEGVLSSQDLEAHDRLVLRFLGRKGLVRAIHDLSLVTALALPLSRVRQRGQQPPILPERVAVAPQGGAGREYIDTVNEQRRQAGHREYRLVETLDEAFALLGLDDPQFEPVENGAG